MESIIPTAEDLFLIVKEANKSIEKRVAFDTNVVTHGSVSEFDSSDIHTSSLWYTKPEIAALQQQVQRASSAIVRGEMASKEIEKEGDLRGLEAYASVARLTHKKEVIAHVLEAQKTLKASKLAKISHDSSTWHKKIALIHALQDYCDVHDPSLSEGIPEMPGSPPPISKLPTLKRRLSSSSLSSHSKRVSRRRLSAE